MRNFLGEGQENYQTVIVGMRDSHAALCNCRIRPTRAMGTFFVYHRPWERFFFGRCAMLRWRVSFRLDKLSDKSSKSFFSFSIKTVSVDDMNRDHNYNPPSGIWHFPLLRSSFINLKIKKNYHALECF